MEGVGVAASLITIIVLGLQSSKFIFKTADGIKGAPTTVRKLVTAAKNISQLLEQVKGLAERAKKILGEQDAKFFEDLRPLLNDCVRDLRHIEGKIGKFAVASDHQLWNNVKTHLHEKDFDKMWNSIHHYVQLFGSQLSHAGVDLGLLNTEYLQLIGDEVTAVSCDMNQRFDNLQILWTKSANQVDAYQQEITSTLRLHSDTAGASATHHSEKIDALQSSLTQISSLSNKYLTKWDELETSFENRDNRLMQTLDDVSDRLRDVSSISAAQSSTIRQLVRMIQGLQLDVQGVHHDMQQIKHGASIKRGSSSFAPSQHNAVESSGLDRSISRLCNLAATEDRELFSAEAQLIIHDLEQITVSLLEETFSADSRHRSMEPDQEVRCGMHNKIKRQRNDALHKISSILRASGRLRISKKERSNALGHRLLLDRPATSRGRRLSHATMPSTVEIGECMLPLYPRSPVWPSKPAINRANHEKALLRRRPGKVTCSENSSRPISTSHWTSGSPTQIQACVSSSELEPFHTQYVIENGFLPVQTSAGRVDVRFKKKSLVEHRGCSAGLTTAECPAEETFLASIILTPASYTGLRTKVVLNVSQEFTNTNSILSTPVLSFRSIIPNTSEIFRIIQYGSLVELQQALSKRSASVTDCDPDGRSLLNYALQALRPTMARFLIEKGADVNSVEMHAYGNVRSSLLWTPFDLKNSLIGRLRTKCTKMLLAYDADPSLMMDFGDDLSMSAFYYDLVWCSLATLKAYLNSESPFISPNFTGDDLRSYPLLELAYIHGHDCTPFNTADKIALLLSRGADVNQRGYSGDNCLHYLMTYNWCPFHSKHVLCRSLEPRGELCRSLKRRDELRDILTLMITAGADVYAVNDYEMSVSDTANRYGHSQVWAEVLETCGYDVHKVYEGDDGGCGWSSAIDDPCQKHVAEQTFKLSFAEYLVRREEKRKVSCPVTEISDYENDEEEYIRERRLRDFALNEEEQSYTSTRNAGSDSDSDMYGEKSNEEEDDAETMRNWNVGGDPDSDEESSEDIYNCKTKRD